MAQIWHDRAGWKGVEFDETTGEMEVHDRMEWATITLDKEEAIKLAASLLRFAVDPE